MYHAVDRYGPSISLETRIMDNKDRILVAVKSDAIRKAEKERQKCKQELNDLQDSVGFSAVIQHLADSVSKAYTLIFLTSTEFNPAV